MHQPRGVRAHVAETLDDHATALDGHVEVAQALVADHHHAAAGGLNAPARAADVDRLAGDHAGHRLAHVHGVGVHDPRHGLLVGVHVRRGNVLLRPDELDDLRGVAARHALQLALAHALGIADDAALGSAEGNIDDRALPGHPTGQRAHFVQRDIGRVADAALARTARHGVLHAEAGEHVDHAVVQGHRKVNDDLPRRRAQHLPQSFIEIQLARGKVEARALRLPGIDLLVQRNAGISGCHI